jgi:copper transport protein
MRRRFALPEKHTVFYNLLRLPYDMFSLLISKTYHLRRSLGLAFLLALLLCLLLPGTSKAYAVLLRSDPASNAVLASEPVQVRLWFSEKLNPTGSTASIVNAANQRVDINGALVLPTDTREMDVALRPDLPPGIYVVIWHTQSANDGQIFNGAFSFSIANADGTVPGSASVLPDQSQLNAGDTGHLNGVTIFRWLMLTLVDLCVIFWVSGKIWHVFVLDPVSAETAEQREIVQLSQERFVQRCSLPTLRVLFLANVGVLAGQALSLSEGRWDLILSPTLLLGLLTSGSFGVFWLIGEVVVALAIMLETMVLFSQQHAPDSAANDTSIWLDLLLGLVLLIMTTLTSYTTASGMMPGVLMILVGGLYLLAAILWLGGMFYLSLVYLPVLHKRSLSAKISSLLMLRQRFSPLAISAAIIMVLSTAYDAIIVRRTPLAQLHTILYQPILIVQIVCIIALLIASVWHFFLLQSSLAKGYEQYKHEWNPISAETDLSCPGDHAIGSCGHDQAVPAEIGLSMHKKNGEEAQELAVATRMQEQNIVRQINRFIIVLRYMLLPAVSIVLCIALMSILVGSF